MDATTASVTVATQNRYVGRYVAFPAYRQRKRGLKWDGLSREVCKCIQIDLTDNIECAPFFLFFVANRPESLTAQNVAAAGHALMSGPVRH